jgi:hypothetical protein
VASPTTLTPPPELDQRLLERPRHHWRGWLIALAVGLSVILSAGLVLNFLGMLPWRGPLSTAEAHVTGVSTTFEVEARSKVSYPFLLLSNGSRIGVTLDSVQPVDATPGIHVGDAWLFVDTPRCHRLSPNFPNDVPQECRTPMAGYALPGHQYGDVGTRVIVVLDSMQPGTYRVSGFDVHYHVGLIHYTTTFADGYVIQATPPPPARTKHSP